MPRYNERRDGGWVDVLKPLKSTTSADEIYNAIAVMQRIRNDGLTYFKENEVAGSRWARGCNDLISLINKFSYRLQVEKIDIAEVLWDFTEEFDHTEKRLHQLLYCDAITEDQRTQIIGNVWDLLSVALRFSVRGALLEHKGKRGETTIIRMYVKLLLPQNLTGDEQDFQEDE